MVHKKLNPRIQISVSIPKMTAQDIDRLVDGVTIRNRSHFIEIAVCEKISQLRKSNQQGKQLSIAEIKKKKK